MAGLGMDLFYSLPQELCDNIFDQVVIDWKFANFIQCRLVNRSFNNAVWAALLRTQRLLMSFRDPSGNPHRWWQPLPLPLILQAIRYEVNHNPVVSSSVGRFINALTSEMIELSRSDPYMSVEAIHEQFYAALFYTCDVYPTLDFLESLSARCSECLSLGSIRKIDILGAACLLGLSDTVERLLLETVDISDPHGIFGRPIKAACIGNQVECMKILWRHLGHRTIFHADLYQWLRYASRAGSTGVVDWLSTLPCDGIMTFTRGVKWSIMWPVCILGHVQTLQSLGQRFFSQLIDPVHEDFCGYMHVALNAAAAGGHVDMIKYLVTIGAGHRCIWSEDTALACAIQAGSLPSIRALLDLGADPTQVDGETHKRPLELAYVCEDAEAIRLLCDAIWRFKV